MTGSRIALLTAIIGTFGVMPDMSTDDDRRFWAALPHTPTELFTREINRMIKANPHHWRRT